MKKVIGVLLIILFLILVFYGIIKDIKRVQMFSYGGDYVDYNSVSYNGWLNVSNNKLLNSFDNEIQLKGISSHGIQWYGDLYTYDNLKNLKETWGINVFRVSMYVNPNDDGYIKNKELKDVVTRIVDDAIKLDMYVIIDWHILNGNDFIKYFDDSVDFFDEISGKYGNCPNVIYEICNEPSKTSWDDVESNYNKLINVIRNNSPKSLIIVGIPGWGKDLDSVLELNYSNIMYSVHFYAGSDDGELKTKIDSFYNKGFPIFVSECGITNSTGDGKIYENKFRSWIGFLDERNISWVFWSFSNKDEGSSLLLPSYYLDSDFNDYLSETGIILKDIFSGY